MAWRFKASKYKNAAPKVSKSEDWIRDLSVDTFQINGSPIDSSASFMAFNVDAGGTVCVLPLTYKGRVPKDNPHIFAHPDVVSALAFSPFDDGLLATGSQDSLVKLWNIPAGGITKHMSTPETTLCLQGVPKRIEALKFHPCADFLLSVVAGTSIQLWDVKNQKLLSSLADQPDTIYTAAWSGDGAMLATTCKDRKVRIVDPRSNKITNEADNHEGQRESLVTWLSDPNLVLTSGFDSSRQRQIFVRDLRKFSDVQGSLVFDSSTGILLPLFDQDTNMMFFCGKTDTTIFYYEIGNKEPMFTEGLRHSGQQMKGACLIPKRGLNVMEGEVNRVLQLVSSGVVPVSYIVPRKTYRDYHSDLFPETNGCEPPLIAEQWITGMNRPVEKISLDPALWKDRSLQVIRAPLSERDATPIGLQKKTVLPSPTVQTTVKMPLSPKPLPKLQPIDENVPVPKPRLVSSPRGSVELKEPIPVPQPRIPSVKRSVSLRISAIEERNIENAPLLRRSDSLRKKASEDASDGIVVSKQNDRISKILGHVSKYRHLKGTVLHRKFHIENIKGFDQSLPAECDGIQVNGKRVAVPLAGPGGRVAVFEVSKTGRIPDGTIPSLFSGCKVMDLAWDPFDDARLAVACEDGRVRIWNIPEDGLTISSNEADLVLESAGNSDRVSIVKFHPLAKNVLATVTSDHKIRVWNLDIPFDPKVILESHNDQIFSVSWSACGKFLATVSKDGYIRVFDPRKNPDEPLRTGAGPSGVKGARIIWAVDGKMLAVSGFDRQSERHLALYKSDDLSEPLHKLMLDVSPILLIPFYDEDSSTVFLTGKGDSTIHCYELSLQAPFAHLLSPHRCSQVHRSIGFMPKSVCNVRQVEFAKAFCLTNTTLEPVSFTVPRLKMDYFQDDLFPPTRQLWTATMSSSEWFSLKDKQAPRVSLQPEGMPALHESKENTQSTPQPATRAVGAPVILPKPSYKKHNREKEEELEKSLSKQISVNMKLEQDEMEGVDADEWDH